jgi:hypothetical protein
LGLKLQLAQNIIRPEAHSTKKHQAHNTIHSNARVNISSISMITAMKMEQTQISSIINTYGLESATSSKYQNTIHPYMSSYHQPNHLQKWIHLRISSIHPSSCSSSSHINKQNNQNIAAEFFLHSCNKTKQCTMQQGCRIQ